MSTQHNISASTSSRRGNSPPRHSSRWSPPHVNGNYPSRNNDWGTRSDISVAHASPASRGIPRGPKAFGDISRGSAFSAPFAPRGRGYPVRGDRRRDVRDHSSFGVSQESPPWTVEHYRSWQDRGVEAPARNSSVHDHAASGDFRDPAPPPPEVDAGWTRKAAREGPAIVGSRNDQPGSLQFSYRGRSGHDRGRGRDDWDARDRGVASGRDHKDSFRARSRSPRTYRKETIPVAEDRQTAGRGERLSLRHEEQKAAERDDREREAQRWKRAHLPPNHDSRRSSAVHSALSTPRPETVLPQPLAQSPSMDRADRHDDNNPALPRHTSNNHVPPPDFRRETQQRDIPQPRNDALRGRNALRTSSPPQAPQVPAFGSVAFKQPVHDARWNVWRAPTEPASFKQSAPPLVVANEAKSMHSAPKISTKLEPPKAPKAPKADREFQQTTATLRIEPATSEVPCNDHFSTSRPLTSVNSHTAVPSEDGTNTSTRSERPPIRSPPSGPKLMSNMPLGPRVQSRIENLSLHQQPPKAPYTAVAASQPPSPVFSAPSGPRAVSVFTTPASFPRSIPTGPKADRNLPSTQQVKGAAVPAISTSWEWTPGLGVPPVAPSSTVPSKRDAAGQKKEQVWKSTVSFEDSLAHHGAASTQPAKPGSSQSDENATSQHLEGSREARRQESSHVKPERASGATLEVETEEVKIGEPQPSITAVDVGNDHFVDDEDHLDLDEGDFAENEAKFQKERALLESKIIDLSSSHLRGSSPLKHLALLARISVHDFGNRKPMTPPGELDAMAIQEADGKRSMEERMLTPKAEEVEDTPMLDSGDAFRNSPSPISSPEIRSLPFLVHAPLTPISDLDVSQDNLARHELFKDVLRNEIMSQLDFRANNDEDLRKEYEQRYRIWRSEVEILDMQKAKDDEEERLPTEPVPQIAVSETSPTAVTATGELRRQRGTDYELYLAMKQSEESARADEARREKQTLKQPDLSKEAVIPDLLSDSVRPRRIFRDTSRLRAPHNAVNFYELQPPEDDFTAEEHRAIVQNFKDYPKKWGKLAQGLPGRSYKDCINHYYATKWDKEYKSRRDSRMKKGTKGRRPGAAKSNALISNLGESKTEIDDADELSATVVAVTDSGRPRRAAAPTWGTKEMDEQQPHVTTVARKSVRPVFMSEPSIEKLSKRPRVPPKEKVQRKPKTQPRMRAMSISPENDDAQSTHRPRTANTDTILGERETELAGVMASLPLGFGEKPTALSDHQAPHVTSSYRSFSDADMIDGHRVLVTQQQQQTSRLITSSYWSVQEVSAFPALLAHFGTDWQMISNYMGTKTQTMVKNYYYRLVGSNNKPEIEDMASKANERRERGEVVGPPPTAMQILRRRNDPMQPMAPRVLAPSTDVMEDEDDIPPVQMKDVVEVSELMQPSSIPIPASHVAHANPRRTPTQVPLPTTFAQQQYVPYAPHPNVQQMQDLGAVFSHDTNMNLTSTPKHDADVMAMNDAYENIHRQISNASPNHHGRLQMPRSGGVGWLVGHRQEHSGLVVNNYEIHKPEADLHLETASHSNGIEIRALSNYGELPADAMSMEIPPLRRHLRQQDSGSQRLMEVSHQPSVTTLRMNRHQQRSPVFAGETHSVRRSEVHKDTRQEQRKTSNLAAILNAEPDELQSSKSSVARSRDVRAQTPPPLVHHARPYPDHIHSQPYQSKIYGDAFRPTPFSTAHPPEQAQGPDASGPLIDRTNNETSSHIISRPDWVSAVNHWQSKTPSQPLVKQTIDPAADASTLFSRRSSHHTLQARHNPSSPPSAGLHYLNREVPMPQLQPSQQVPQQSQQPGHIPQPKNPGPSQARSPHLRTLSENQQGFNHNLAIQEHGRRISVEAAMERRMQGFDHVARGEMQNGDDQYSHEERRNEPNSLQHSQRPYEPYPLQEDAKRFSQTHRTLLSHNQDGPHYGYNNRQGEEYSMPRTRLEPFDGRQGWDSLLTTRPSSTPARPSAAMDLSQYQVRSSREIQSTNTGYGQLMDGSRTLQTTRDAAKWSNRQNWFHNRQQSANPTDSEVAKVKSPKLDFEHLGRRPAEVVPEYEFLSNGLHQQTRRRREQTEAYRDG